MSRGRLEEVHGGRLLYYESSSRYKSMTDVQPARHPQLRRLDGFMPPAGDCASTMTVFPTSQITLPAGFSEITHFTLPESPEWGPAPMNRIKFIDELVSAISAPGHFIRAPAPVLPRRYGYHPSSFPGL